MKKKTVNIVDEKTVNLVGRERTYPIHFLSMGCTSFWSLLRVVS